VPTAGLFSSLGTVINIETNCNTALLIVVWGLGVGEFDSKRKGGRRGWRNLHKDEPDDLYI